VSDSAIVAIATSIAIASGIIFVAVRHVAAVLDEARRDAAEAWKEALGEREARARAEANVMHLRGLYERKLPLPAPGLDVHSRTTSRGEAEDARATAPVSKDTLRAILIANHIEPVDEPVDYGADEPTQPTHP
jgi:hypothetical protein